LKNEPNIKLTLQHILQQYLDSTEVPLTPYQGWVLHQLRHCKTPYFGGHWTACSTCGVLERHYNSCGNRHCPQCQGAKREQWIMARENDLFDVEHHHVTFTIPCELRNLFYHNQKKCYDLLFKSMWETLRSFARDPRSRLQADIGVIAILHTWTQQLMYHPHLHCIVPVGGLTADGQWKHKKGKFLFSVKALSQVFRNKLCDGLKRLHANGDLSVKLNDTVFYGQLAILRKKKWVVNSKPGFAGRSSVLEYLGRYTHKVAISNYRLISLENGRVTFSYRDRKAGDIKKIMSLTVKEFIQRFSWHILPKGLIKIRHYGLFSTRVKKVKLALVRKALGEAAPKKPIKLSVAEVILQTTGQDIHLCSECQGVLMITTELPPARGSPSHRFPTQNPSSRD